MPIRIISGIIRPAPNARKGGTIFIDLNSHSLTRSCETEGRLVRTTECGFDGIFIYRQRPCKVLGLHHIKYGDERDCKTLETRPFNDQSFCWLKEQMWDITDTFVYDDDIQLQVTWRTRGGAEIHEISYMIIGEAREREIHPEA